MTVKPRVIKVPETPRPKTGKWKNACWKRQPGMGFVGAFCTYTRGHKGPHQWQGRE